MSFILETLNNAGWISYPLLSVCFLMTYFLALRWMELKKFNLDPKTMTRHSDESELLQIYAQKIYQHQSQMDVNQNKAIIKSLVVIAPLLGLLGTVVGMIETFESLDGMQMHSSSGGIAGGIAQAMLTTEMGLIIAIPGLLLSKWLDRQQQVWKENTEKNMARARIERIVNNEVIK